MIRGVSWHLLRAAALALIVTVVVSGVDHLAGRPTTSVALARDDNDKKDNKNRGNDDDEDHVARGMVLEINTLKDPPELIIGGFDGEMVVRVVKTDEVSLKGVRLCDHLKLDGEKIHEYLFEATQIEVETKRRCRAR